MSQSSTLFIGMDVHKDSIAVAHVAQDHGAEVMYLGAIGTRHWDLDPLLPQRGHRKPNPASSSTQPAPVATGSTGSSPHKATTAGSSPPPAIPKKAGDRVKTDRRDAVQLARLARSGDRTAVDVPPVEDEAMRDLTRARCEDAISARKDATCRLKALWLRQDIPVCGPGHWGPGPPPWLSEVVCPTPAQHIVFQA